MRSREVVDEAVVEEYVEAMQAGIKFPPIVVFSNGIDHWVGDGFHRVEAANEAGLDATPPSVGASDESVDSAQWSSVATIKSPRIPGETPEKCLIM